MLEKAFGEFIDEVKEKKLFVEGVAVADGEKLLLEHRFLPDLPRDIYSHAKSYTSTAVGIALAEGKLTLEDKLADYFPEALPKDPQPELFRITLRHLLTMSSGFNYAYLMRFDRRAGVALPDYLTYMLSRPVEYEPGDHFVYSTGDTYLIGRMVEKATGRNLSEYLYEKLFFPLGQGFPIWECCPAGHPMGGAGLFMRLTEMMKLGQLYLSDGIWKGERLVESSWIREATAKQIDIPGEENNVWKQGYGYQFWLSAIPGCYRADGAYGQITAVLPERGLIVGIQCPEYGDFSAVKPALYRLMSEV